MKRILTVLLLIVVVVLIIFVSKRNDLEGVWKCTSYALLNDQDQSWNEQGPALHDMFELKIFDDEKIVVSSSGNETEGIYTMSGDTLVMTIKGNTTYYLHDKETLTLVKHPRAKIVYTKTGKIEME